MKNKNLLIVILVSICSLILSLFVLYTPMAKEKMSDFSAIEAVKHISEISREPHSVFDEEAHEQVRLYIKEQLESYVGVSNVAEMDYPKEEVGEIDYDVKNILATIPGKSSTGILLVAHYDSRGHVTRFGELARSFGAADDGYGVGTLLEIARLFGKEELENSIYILVTDAEETDLYGARMAAQNADLMDKVSFVINVEARGVKGPAFMFETSKNNEKVIELYKKANYPVTYSIATAVYTVMTNYTDFTEFTNVGKPGVNFSVLDNLYYYHTPHDNYTNINLSSIQHYGEQIVPMVEEFVTQTKYSDVNYFASDSNQVFFLLFPNVLVSYSETFAIILNFVVLILFVLLVFLFIKEKKVSGCSILKQFGMLLLGIIFVVMIGFIISRIVTFIGRVPWSITYVRMKNTGIPTIISILLVAFFAFAYVKKQNKSERMSLMIAGIGLNILFAFLTGFVLSGASFLFFVPAFIATITLLVTSFVNNKMLKHIALSQNTLWNFLILIPLLYALFLAITIGGLLALLLIETLFLSIMIPSVVEQLNL